MLFYHTQLVTSAGSEWTAIKMILATSSPFQCDMLEVYNMGQGTQLSTIWNLTPT